VTGLLFQALERLELRPPESWDVGGIQELAWCESLRGTFRRKC